jgi:adenylate cyclase
VKPERPLLGGWRPAALLPKSFAGPGVRRALKVSAVFGIGMTVANLVGAVIVYVFLAFIVPTQDSALGTDRSLVNLIVFLGYVGVGFLVGAVLSVIRFLPLLRWLVADRPPTAHERELAVRQPLRQAQVHALIWFLALLVFVPLNVTYSVATARDIGLTILMGGATVCALGYLLAERILRSLVRRALSGAELPDASQPGVRARLLLAWALGTGVPLVGLGLAALLGPDADRGMQSIGPVLFLSGIGLSVGWLAIYISARSIGDRVDAVRAALDKVGQGELDVVIDVDDASEVGLLQRQVNDTVAGLRERERIRELFGKQVGADVARQAMEEGVDFNGESTDVAVLFIDLTGSTELASSRPPDEVVALLNQFFGVVVEEVDSCRGLVNKFEGDAALCIWGAPVPNPDAEADALRCARVLAERLAALRETHPELEAGIAVASGTVVAGNVGAADRYEYTVIGDPVNEAARLTMLAKEEDGRVLASEVAVQRAGSEARAWQAGDEVTLRGRSQPTRVYRPRPDAAVDAGTPSGDSRSETAESASSAVRRSATSTR